MEDWPLILYNVDVQALGPSSWVQIRLFVSLVDHYNVWSADRFYVEEYTY